MDYQKFIQQLPNLYENWGQESVRPKSNRFGQVLKQVQGLTTVNVLQLLNWAVDCMEPDEIYCEVGCFRGSTLIGALLDHPNQMAYAVDDFSALDPSENNLDILINNLTHFNLEEQVYFCNQDFEDFFLELQTIKTSDKIGVYFYDGAHDYRAQLLGLLLVKPFLANNALIIVANSNWSGVQQANWDFMAAHPQCRLLVNLPTPEFGHFTFWNGLQVFSWDVNYDSNYDHSTFKQVRQEFFLEALSQAQLTFAYESNNTDNQDLIQQLYTKAVEFQKSGQFLEAEKNYKRIIQLNNKYIDAYSNWGNIFYEFRNFTEAEVVYRAAIKANPTHYGSYLNLGNTLYDLGRIDEAIAAYKTALILKPLDIETLNNLVLVLENYGRIQEAINVLHEALILVPNNLSLKFRNNLILPIIYENLEQIGFYRQRFTQGLEELIQQVSLNTPEEINNAVASLEYTTNFYLAYQGYDDLELQRQYGQLVHRIMAAKYPQWIQPLPMLPLTKDGKIRVGYISYCGQRTVSKLFAGWLIEHDPQKFEVHFYSPFKNLDALVEDFKDSSDIFHQLLSNLDAICKQILSDQLHILVFLDISMHAQITQLAALRLAPVQMTTWAHPITSGLPTIDYFLSNDLMEPEDAKKHYSEQLICLPNIGIYYSKPVVPDCTKTRSYFYLSEKATIYLSCQSLFKYLPQYDYIFSAIAQQVPKAQFVFLGHKSPDVTGKFKQRLWRSFEKYGKNYEDYCIFLGYQDQNSYFNLNLVSDVFLDTLTGLRQKLSPNEAQTSLIRSKYVTMNG